MSAILARRELRPRLPIAHLDSSEVPARAWTRASMNRALDELSLKFVIASRSARAPVMDFGCGDGLVTAAALARGAHVCALDSDEAATRRLLARVPVQQHPRLRVWAGSLLGTDFKAAHFGAIHAARVLQEFDGAGVESVLRKFFRWLYPNGRLYVSALTPIGEFWDGFESEFRRRCAQGEHWPGHIDDVSKYTRNARDSMPVHLLDESTLRRALKAAGFVIETIRCLPLPWDDTQIACAAIARCGS